MSVVVAATHDDEAFTRRRGRPSDAVVRPEGDLHRSPRPAGMSGVELAWRA